MINYLEEMSNKEVECNCCQNIRKIGEKNWLFSIDKGFYCPRCARKYYYRKMEEADLLFKISDDCSSTSEKMWVALDLDGEEIVRGNTKKECIDNAKKLLKYGIIFDDSEAAEEKIKAHREILKLLKNVLPKYLDEKYTWVLCGRSSDDNDILDKLEVSCEKAIIYADMAEIRDAFEESDSEEVICALAEQINEQINKVE